MLSKKIFFLIIIPCFLVADQSQWTGNVDTTWQTPGNWSNGIPGITNGGVNNPDLEAHFGGDAMHYQVQLVEPVTLNTITFEGDYSLSGSELILGGGSLPVNFNIISCIVDINNPLTVNNSGSLQVLYGSSLHITNSFQAIDANIGVNTGFIYFPTIASFKDSQFSFQGSVLTFDSILSDNSTLDLTKASSVSLNSGTFSNKSNASILNVTVATIISDNSQITLNNVNCPSATFQNYSNLFVIGNGGHTTITEFLCNESSVSVLNNSSFFFSTGILTYSTFSVTNAFSNGGTLNLSSSVLDVTNSNIILKNLNLVNSELFLTNNGINCVITDSVSEDSNSLISLNNSQLQYQGKNTIQPGVVNFILADGNVSDSNFISYNADIDLSNTNSVVIFNGSLSKSKSFSLFEASSPYKIDHLDPNSFTLPPFSENITWHGPVISSNTTGESVIVTADVAHSPSSAIRSVMSATSQGTLATAKQLENTKANARMGDQTYLTSNVRSSGDYFAQNDVLAQATPVEQLGERGVYRPSHQWSFYLAPTGSVGTLESKHRQPGSDFYSAGFFTGFDWITSGVHDPDRNFGFGIGSTFYYSHFHAETDRHAGKVDIDLIYGQVYGTLFSHCLEELSFNFAVGGGYDWHQIERVTGHFGSLVAHADTGGYEVGGFAGLEYLFSQARYCNMGNFRFMPMLYLQYHRIAIDEYREHGAGEFNLRVHSDALDSLRSFLGARANYLFSVSCNVTIRPEITLGWQREYLSDNICSRFSTISAVRPQEICSTIAPERNTLIVGADVYMMMYEWTSLELSYQFTYNNLLRDHEFYLQWKVEF